MGQIRGSDNIPSVVKASTTSLTLAATYLGKPTRLTLGGQQYTISSALTLNTATIGLNGLDAGSLASNTLYYVYGAVNTGGTVGLVASLSAPATGPSGFAANKFLGRFRTDFAAAAVNTVAMDASIQPQGAAFSSVTLTPAWTNTTGMTVTNALTTYRYGEELVLNGYSTFVGDGSSASTIYLNFSGLTIIVANVGSPVRVELKTTGAARTYDAFGTAGGINLYTSNTGMASVALPGAATGDVTSGDVQYIYWLGARFRVNEWVGLFT